MLTSFADDEALFDAIMAGASGYVLKQIRGNDLVDGRPLGGGRTQSLLDPRATRGCCDRLRQRAKSDAKVDALTEQERGILDLIGEG